MQNGEQTFLDCFSYLLIYFTKPDRPGKPEGPLEISDIHKEGCKLKWDKPKDDGGVPISGYTVEKMDVTTGITGL